MTKPITPQEVDKVKSKGIPAYVIEIINKLIAQNWDGKRAIVKQEDIVLAILEKNKIDKEFKRQYIFDNDYLEFESLYESVGWKVTYDKPGYNESYSATFTFKIHS